MAKRRPLDPSEPQIGDLVAFLASLTGPPHRELGARSTRAGSDKTGQIAQDGFYWLPHRVLALTL